MGAKESLLHGACGGVESELRPMLRPEVCYRITLQHTPLEKAARYGPLPPLSGVLNRTASRKGVLYVRSPAPNIENQP